MRTDELFGQLKALETECQSLGERCEETLRRLERRDAVALVRAPDFGKQRFMLTITLDEFNIESAETLVREAVTLARERIVLRQKMWALQKELGSQEAFLKELRNTGLGETERRVATW